MLDVSPETMMAVIEAAHKKPQRLDQRDVSGAGSQARTARRCRRVWEPDDATPISLGDRCHRHIRQPLLAHSHAADDQGIAAGLSGRQEQLTRLARAMFLAAETPTLQPIVPPRSSIVTLLVCGPSFATVSK
jgi:hypothetical protein